MSVFQVTRASDKARMTVNAANVVSVADTNPVILSTTLGDVTVDETYRSVRGYLKKALAASATADNDAE
jgi:hypothetical protein